MMIEPFNNQKFGVEIECFDGDADDLLMPEGWGHHHDGSVDGDGGEYVSPILQGKEGFESVIEACEALREAGFEVNRSCGLHVHFNYRGEDLSVAKKVVIAYLLYDDFFWRMLPESRRENGYCKKAKPHYSALLEHLEGNLKKFSPGRYVSVNTQSLFSKGSLEIRSHTGTLNSRKILYWIRLHQKFQAWAKSKSLKYFLKHKPSTHTWFQEIINDKDLEKYYKEREKLFNNDRRKEYVEKNSIRLIDGYKVPLDRGTVEILMSTFENKRGK